MGKSGAALRAEKKQRATYTFTAAQLEDHDRAVIRDYQKRFHDTLKAKVDEEVAKSKAEAIEEINATWKARADEFHTGNAGWDFMMLMQYLLSVSARILIEDFGWMPPGNGKGRPRKIERFADRVAEIIGEISADDLADITTYSKETFDKYGLQFKFTEEKG